ENKNFDGNRPPAFPSTVLKDFIGATERFLLHVCLCSRHLAGLQRDRRDNAFPLSWVSKNQQRNAARKGASQDTLMRFEHANHLRSEAQRIVGSRFSSIIPLIVLN